MEQAVFSLQNYSFDKVTLDFANIGSDTFRLDIRPRGVFVKEEKKYILTFEFLANDNMTDKNVMSVICNATFLFKDEISFDEIPTYFYANSIAIIFPYVRAFVSTVSLQSNRPAIVLPTMNLSSLQEELKNNSCCQ